MTLFHPTPTVRVPGMPACTAEVDADGRPVLAGHTATLTGEMRIRWGRSDPWSTIEPTTLDVELFDPTGEWLNRIVAQGAMGHEVTVSWDVPDHVPDDDDLPDRRWYVFNGFITAVDIEAATRPTTDGHRDGWTVTITAADRRVALGNILAPWEDWGAERMIDRAVRLRNWSAPSGIREFYYDDRYRESPVSPVEIRDSTALELFGELYESFGQQWTYNPHRNVCIRIPRHLSHSDLVLIKVDPGPYITLMGVDLYDQTGQETDQDQAPQRAASIDACDVTGGVTLHTDQIDDLNRWEATWRPRPDHETFTTVLMPDGEDTAPPWRSLSFDSWLSDGLDLDPVLYSVADKARLEARGPHHPAVTFDTGRVGGFRNVAQAMALTLPAEVGRTVVLTGSPWTAALNRPPLHAICGGEIIYGAGRWTITVDLVTHDGVMPDAADAVAWDDLVDFVHWGSTGHDNWRLADGVSWADMRWIEDGAIYGDWS